MRKGGLYSIHGKGSVWHARNWTSIQKDSQKHRMLPPPPKKGTIMRELNPYQTHDYLSHCMRNPAPFSRVLRIPGWFDGNDGKSLPTTPLVKLWRVEKKVMWVREEDKKAVQGTTMNDNLSNHSIPLHAHLSFCLAVLQLGVLGWHETLGAFPVLSQIFPDFETGWNIGTAKYTQKPLALESHLCDPCLILHFISVHNTAEKNNCQKWLDSTELASDPDRFLEWAWVIQPQTQQDKLAYIEEI